MTPMTPNLLLFPRPEPYSPHAHALTVQGDAAAVARFCQAAGVAGPRFDTAALLGALGLGLDADRFVEGLAHQRAGAVELHFKTMGPIGAPALHALHRAFGLDGRLVSQGDGLDDLGAFQGWVQDGEVNMVRAEDLADEDQDDWLDTVFSALDRRTELEYTARYPEFQGETAPRGPARWRTGS